MHIAKLTKDAKLQVQMGHFLLCRVAAGQLCAVYKPPCSGHPQSYIKTHPLPTAKARPV